MSTVTAPQWELDVSGTAKVPFHRLVRVELRKMLDTRGGFWLLLLTGIFLAITVVIVALVVGLTESGAPGLMDWGTAILILPLSILLPVFPILSVTSEWGQRTGLVTFTLEANRVRVLGAKLVAVLALALGTVVLAAVLALIGTPLGAALAGESPVWNVDWAVLGGTALVQLLFFLMAFAIATALLSTPGAISLFYVMGLMVPIIVYSTLFVIFEWARDVIPFIDLQFGTSPLLTGEALSGKEVGQMLTSCFIWIVVPLALGVTRILRSEVK